MLQACQKWSRVATYAFVSVVICLRVAHPTISRFASTDFELLPQDLQAELFTIASLPSPHEQIAAYDTLVSHFQTALESNPETISLALNVVDAELFSYNRKELSTQDACTLIKIHTIISQLERIDTENKSLINRIKCFLIKHEKQLACGAVGAAAMYFLYTFLCYGSKRVEKYYEQWLEKCHQEETRIEKALREEEEIRRQERKNYEVRYARERLVRESVFPESKILNSQEQNILAQRFDPHSHEYIISDRDAVYSQGKVQSLSEQLDIWLDNIKIRSIDVDDNAPRPDTYSIRVLIDPLENVIDSPMDTPKEKHVIPFERQSKTVIIPYSRAAYYSFLHCKDSYLKQQQNKKSFEISLTSALKSDKVCALLLELMYSIVTHSKLVFNHPLYLGEGLGVNGPDAFLKSEFDEDQAILEERTKNLEAALKKYITYNKKHTRAAQPLSLDEDEDSRSEVSLYDLDQQALRKFVETPSGRARIFLEIFTDSLSRKRKDFFMEKNTYAEKISDFYWLSFEQNIDTFKAQYKALCPVNFGWKRKILNKVCLPLYYKKIPHDHLLELIDVVCQNVFVEMYPFLARLWVLYGNKLIKDRSFINYPDFAYEIRKQYFYAYGKDPYGEAGSDDPLVIPLRDLFDYDMFAACQRPFTFDVNVCQDSDSALKFRITGTLNVSIDKEERGNVIIKLDSLGELVDDLLITNLDIRGNFFEGFSQNETTNEAQPIITETFKDRYSKKFGNQLFGLYEGKYVLTELFISNDASENFTTKAPFSLLRSLKKLSINSQAKIFTADSLAGTYTTLFLKLPCLQTLPADMFSEASSNIEELHLHLPCHLYVQLPTEAFNAMKKLKKCYIHIDNPDSLQEEEQNVLASHLEEIMKNLFIYRNRIKSEGYTEEKIRLITPYSNHYIGQS